MSIPKVKAICSAMRGHPQRGLRCFISTTARIRSVLGPFGPGLVLRFAENRSRYFSMNQSAMKVEKRRWFHRDCGSHQLSRQHKYRAPSGDKPVGGAEIRPSVSGTIENQQLM